MLRSVVTLKVMGTHNSEGHCLAISLRSGNQEVSNRRHRVPILAHNLAHIILRQRDEKLVMLSVLGQLMSNRSLFGLRDQLPNDVFQELAEGRRRIHDPSKLKSLGPNPRYQHLQPLELLRPRVQPYEPS